LVGEITLNCSVCGRELKEDSIFCDMCSNPVEKTTKNQDKKISFNHQALFLGIFFSIIITAVVSVFTKTLGLPILFGGLFLPFLFSIKKNKKV
jgi:predicted nucleic acid-binding Zn ribbon protein